MRRALSDKATRDEPEQDVKEEGGTKLLIVVSRKWSTNIRLIIFFKYFHEGRQLQYSNVLASAVGNSYKLGVLGVWPRYRGMIVTSWAYTVRFQRSTVRTVFFHFRPAFHDVFLGTYLASQVWRLESSSALPCNGYIRPPRRRGSDEQPTALCFGFSR